MVHETGRAIPVFPRILETIGRESGGTPGRGPDHHRVRTAFPSLPKKHPSILVYVVIAITRCRPRSARTPCLQHVAVTMDRGTVPSQSSVTARLTTIRGRPAASIFACTRMRLSPPQPSQRAGCVNGLRSGHSPLRVHQPIAGRSAASAWQERERSRRVGGLCGPLPPASSRLRRGNKCTARWCKCTQPSAHVRTA